MHKTFDQYISRQDPTSGISTVVEEIAISESGHVNSSSLEWGLL
jgi:hypothetical protein